MEKIDNQDIDLSLLKGKRGVIMGVANDHSIAWGIAKALNNAGAELAFSYQSDTLKKRVDPLASQLNSKIVLPCDVESSENITDFFSKIASSWGSIDFVVHAIAFSDKSQLKGNYYHTTKDNFIKTMLVSCYSFTEIARESQKFMSNGGSLLTLTFGGSNRVMPNYNAMGIAKAGLEASVKYLASDFGEKNIRVNAISAGPMRTLAGAAIANAREVYKHTQENSPLKRNVNLEEIGNSALFLVSNLSQSITGEIHYVDCGYNIIGMPKN